MGWMTNIGMLVTCQDSGLQDDVHTIENAAIAWENGRITFAGSESRMDPALKSGERFDGKGKMVVPGLVDCHTHLAFGGWRGDEFARRIAGVGYLEIAREGGGIARTVRETRRASLEELESIAYSVLQEMVSLGITSVECKSGYGLNLEDEIKQLRVYQRLEQRGDQPVRLVPTCLGAHVVPPEFKSDRKCYIRLLKDELIPFVGANKLARFFDVFVEDTAFSIDEARELIECARENGLGGKLHADQLSNTGGARLAAETGCISADHLECIDEEGIAAMAEAGTVAVSLPIATLYLGQKPIPARACIDAGIPVAVATDFNPGSAPSFHLPLAMMLACTMQKMTPAEVVKGATIIAAKAISEDENVGSLEIEKCADFFLIDAPDVNHWMYHFRANATLETFIGGELVWRSDA